MRGAGRLRRLGTSVRRRLARRGVVLLYHRVAAPTCDPAQLCVSPEHFAAQLQVLRDSAHPLGLEEFEARRIEGTLPRRAVAVTFDDGYQDNLTTAAPLLVRAEIPATVFVTTGAVGSPRGFWWDELAALLLGLPLPDAPLQVALDDGAPAFIAMPPHDPVALYQRISERLRPMALQARERALSQLADRLHRTVPVPEIARACDRNELRALAATPGITIGAHSVTHSVMARQSDAELERETGGCREALATLLGAPPQGFAYPFGSLGDISPAAVAAVQQAGFAFGCANVAGAAWSGSDRWRMPRELVRDWDAATFRAHLDRWLAA